MRRVRLSVFLALAVSLTAVAGVAAQTKRQSDFEKLDGDQLAKTLGELGMGQLLKGLPSDQQVAGLRGLAEGKLLAAMKAGPAEQSKLIDSVIADYRIIVKNGADARTESQQLNHYRDRLRLASLLGVTKINQAVGMLLYLKGTEADAVAVRDSAGRAVDLFDALIPEAREKAEELRDDWKAIATGIPQALTDIHDLAVYKGAWTRFHLATAMAFLGNEAGGLSVADEDRRQQLLGEAATAVVNYADGDADSGVKHYSLLLCGMASKDLGEYENSVDSLGRAAEDDAPGTVRLQATFELAKLAIEQAEWQVAEKHAQAYRQLGKALKQRMVGVDLDAAFLRNHILLQHAAAVAAKDAKAAKALRDQAQQQFVALFKAYPDDAAGIAELVGRRYTKVDNIEDLDGLIVYAKGIVLVRNSKGDKNEALRCFNEVLKRTDETSKQFHETCKWQIIVVQYQIGKAKAAEGWTEREAAARKAREFAVAHPKNPNAYGAAKASVQIYRARIDALTSGKHTVPPPLRQAYIESVGVLLGRLKDKPGEAAKYYYSLAIQYDILEKDGDPKDSKNNALKYYLKVPTTEPDYPLAVFNALTLRTRKLEATTGTDRRTDARQLIGDMRAYVESVRKGLPAATVEQRKVLARQGALVDLNIARLLNQEQGDWKEAIAHSETLEGRWPSQPDLAQRSWAFRIQVLLQQEQTTRAVDSLDRFRKKFPEKAEALVLNVALRIRSRIAVLSNASSNEAKAKIVEWRKVYYDYARIADEETKDRPKKDRFIYRQMLAEAMTESNKVDEALALYAELLVQRPGDPMVIRGQARCYWLKKDFAEAKKRYDRLVRKLDFKANTELWWQIQLDRLRCVFDYAKDNPASLPNVLTMVKQAGEKGQANGYGGCYGRYANLLNEVKAAAARN